MGRQLCRFYDSICQLGITGHRARHIEISISMGRFFCDLYIVFIFVWRFCRVGGVTSLIFGISPVRPDVAIPGSTGGFTRN